MKIRNLFLMTCLVCITLLAVTVACGDDDDDDDNNDAGDDDVVDYTDECTAMCNKLEECMGDAFYDMSDSMEECIDGCVTGIASDQEVIECIADCGVTMECDAWFECIESCVPAM